MKFIKKVFNFLLILILTLLFVILCYNIYLYIIGEETTIGEFGYPIFDVITQEDNEIKISSDIFGAVEPTEVTAYEEPSNTKNKNLYNQLNNNSKIIYSELYKNKENMKSGTYTVEFGNTFSETLSLDNGSEILQKDYQSAIEALLYDNPDIFYLDVTNMYLNIEKITKITGVKYNVYINNGNKTNYLSTGFYSKEDINKAEQEIKTEKEKILSMTYGKSDYEKLKIIHDYLIDTIEYETTLLEDNIYNIYGALVNKKCVCEGYAKSYQYLLNELGIQNVIVIGTGTNSNNETENHAWNYVYLDNNWYAVDVTWDDPIIIGGGKLSQKEKYRYFLKGKKSFNSNHTSTGYFTDGGQLFTYPTLSLEDYK